MIITKKGLRIEDRGEVFKGAPVVEPRDDLFWFNCPSLLLFIIHLVFFQFCHIKHYYVPKIVMFAFIMINCNRALKLEFMDLIARNGLWQWRFDTSITLVFSKFSLFLVPLKALFVCLSMTPLGPGAANFIIDHAEVDFVFIEDKKVKELLNPECKSSKRLKDKLKLIRVTTMVCFISLTKEETAKATAIRIKPYSWHDFLHLGKEYPKSTFPPQAHDICAIMYTSGTSGDPKGVVLTNENVMALVRGMDLFMEQFEDKMIVDDVYLSFLPLAHILDCTIKIFVSGIKKAVEELNPVRRIVFGMLYNYKLGWMKKQYKHRQASRLTNLLAFRKIEIKGRESANSDLYWFGHTLLTKEAIKDGWFHTGDIGEMLPNGVIKIIDMNKNLVKLSQGEYIALEHLENVYGVTPIVEDIWVYGNSFKSMLVAVVVPNEEVANKWAYSNGHIASFSKLYFLDQLKKYVLFELKLIVERNKLRGFEHIKGVILEPHEFDMKD
ncbi:Long chain acyl-CoA synthetase 1 [Glycine max]|nr:Long chain acyl-CoA synthetase 1 [Glycine max]